MIEEIKNISKVLLIGAGLFSIVSIIYSIDIITFKSIIEMNNNWTEKSFSSIVAQKELQYILQNGIYGLYLL